MLSLYSPMPRERIVPAAKGEERCKCYPADSARVNWVVGLA
jgi:hypothetical protein